MKIILAIVVVVIAMLTFNINIKDIHAALFSFHGVNSYIDEAGMLRVIGEVKNLDTVPMNNVIVEADFYDESGSLLNTYKRQSELRILPGNNSASPFEILYIDTATVPEVSNFTLKANGEITQLKPNLLDFTSNSSRLDLFGVYYINGKIRNNGNNTSINTMAIATLYDKDNNVIAIGRAQTEPSSIRPESEASFGIAVTERTQTYKTFKYSLLAESNQYTTIPEFSTSYLIMLPLILTMVIVIRPVLVSWL